jgi:signal transduction histidine kinase
VGIDGEPKAAQAAQAELDAKQLEIAELRHALTVARADLESLRAEARTATDVRDAFFDAAAHDLRTPLHVMTLQLSALTTGPAAQLVPEPLRARVASIDVQVQHLVRLTDRLVDASLLMNGRLPLRRSRLDLVSVTSAAVRRLDDTLRWAGCDVQMQAPTSLFIDADAVRLDEVVGNLLANAAKYAPGSAVTVAVDTAGAGGTSHARIVIADRGPGIPAHMRDRIFEKFERGDRPKGTSGLGLGLWIARQIVEAHGGTLVVEDVPQGGAAFVVELPASASV